MGCVTNKTGPEWEFQQPKWHFPDTHRSFLVNEVNIDWFDQEP